MFSSLLRASRSQRRRSRLDRPASESSTRRRDFSSLSRTFRGSPRRGGDSINGSDAIEEDEAEDDEHDAEEDDDDEDEDADDNTPLLPIFSASHLDAIPVFQLTHVFRELVVARCETVLSWEQLRSPQVTQFLLKPIQSEILQHHLNAGTMYALMANCLQFQKEAAMYPGNSGTSNTRSMVCELLAIRLLREYSIRELIDALCYDFDPFQGQTDHKQVQPGASQQNLAPRRPPQRVARVSCYEVSLRAQAKRFLSHPLVVQQLESIWAGVIVFHSAADSMHRKLPLLRANNRTYGTAPDPKASSSGSAPYEATMRRAVTIYNPRDASLFKLSRLRVPRYRNVLSTISFAVLLVLFVAVLVERSRDITNLEVLFWLWAAGYMLDEIVGFNEQGFSLYIASFWNTFDLGKDSPSTKRFFVSNLRNRYPSHPVGSSLSSSIRHHHARRPKAHNCQYGLRCACCRCDPPVSSTVFSSRSLQVFLAAVDRLSDDVPGSCCDLSADPHQLQRFLRRIEPVFRQ
jgi:hypothetical protein